MAKLKFGSAGVTSREIDLTGPTTQQPIGVPAGIIGTSLSGPAFVPVTVGNISDWTAKFGATDGKKFGPLAVREWLRNAQAVTYLRVLGTGDGKKRNSDGTVTNSGFTVGEEQPSDQTSNLDSLDYNFYANQEGPLGRTYFLGCFMSESAGSKIFSEAGLQTEGENVSIPIIRGVLMAPSGVIIRMSASLDDHSGITSNAPSSTLIATEATSEGSTLGAVVLSSNNISKKEFALLLNGHKGTNELYPNVITASFDLTSNNYFPEVLNTDPLKIQEAGHYLYAHWDIHDSLATVTGSGVINQSSGSQVLGGYEHSAFLVSGSSGRDQGSASSPNFENFRDRFSHAVSPWFISQNFGGSRYNLFRLHALDDGSSISNKLKISIENINKSSDPLNKYGTFDLVLRMWEDRDLDKKVLSNEKFAGVTLDPTSDRYIAKVIGDLYAYYDFDRELSSQKLVIEGNYQNRSNYVRVEVHPDVINGFVDPEAMPLGFRGIDHLVTSGSGPLSAIEPSTLSDVLDQTDTNFLKNSVTPPLPFRHKITTGEEWSFREQVEKSFYWGVQFEHPESLLKKNGSILKNVGLESFAKYFPNFSVGEAKFLTGSNSGQEATDEFGVIDSDLFCNNLFTLENIQVVTASSGNADPEKWNKAVYVRSGVPSGGGYLSSEIGATDSAKTRALRMDDFPENKKYLKYTTLMQGGFDGVNIFNSDEKEINNLAVVADMTVGLGRGLKDGPSISSYLKAIEIMKNTVNVDIQLLAIPGIREPLVTDTAIQATEERFDALYIMDIEQQNENEESIRTEDDIPAVSSTVTTFKNRAVDSSFAAAYFPDVLYSDPNGTNLYVPPSVVVLGALSLNDAVGHPWFAPAGFTRGALPQDALEARVKFTQNDLDNLYDNSINPLVAFPGAPRSGTNPASGLVVWGQKTLQLAASSLDRVNVRRLLIEIRRQVRNIAQTIIFEPNREATLARFSAAVTPKLQRIQALSGLERFKVVIDSSTTTQDDILNNTLRGKIFVQPTKSIEFVSLDFVVSNNIQE